MRNHSVSDQLEALYTKIERRQSMKSNGVHPFYMFEFPPVLNLEGDGVDHINCWEGGQTRLGRMLCHTVGLPVFHHIFGRFKTMQGFWYFVMSPSQDDEFRTLTGRALHSLVMRSRRRPPLNFRAIILDTYYSRVMASAECRDLLKKNDLPLDSYYVRRENGLRIRPNFFKWFLPMLAELESAVKEDRKPNYMLFMNDLDTGIYDAATPRCVLDTLTAQRAVKKARIDRLATLRAESKKRKLESLKADQTSPEEILVEGPTVLDGGDAIMHGINSLDISVTEVGMLYDDLDITGGPAAEAGGDPDGKPVKATVSRLHEPPPSAMAIALKEAITGKAD